MFVFLQIFKPFFSFKQKKKFSLTHLRPDVVDGVDARYRVQGLDPGTRVLKNCSISNGSIDVTCVLFMLFIGCFLNVYVSMLL